MTAHELEDRIRALGNSGNAPHVPIDRIVAKGRIRKTQRRILTTAVAVIIVAPALTWVFINHSGPSQGNRPVAGVSTKTPPQSLLAPACPPRGPELLSGPSATDTPLDQPIVAKAGDQVTLSAAMLASPADRPVTSVRFIMGVPAVDSAVQGTNSDVLKPENQVTSVLVTAPGNRFTTELTIPGTTAPGNYPIYIQFTWPGPSLCGSTNDPNSTMVGESLRQAGTLSVSN